MAGGNVRAITLECIAEKDTPLDDVDRQRLREIAAWIRSESIARSRAAKGLLPQREVKNHDA